MENKANASGSAMRLHPMVIFWLGVITGALVVGLLFLQQFMNSADYQSAVLNKGTTLQNQQLQTTPKTTVPTTPSANIGDQGAYLKGTNYIGDPAGY